MQPSTVLKQSARQVSCNLNEEVAILDMDKSVYFGLNGVGAHIWAALAEPRSVSELRQSILEAFDVEPKACEADLLKFLGRLREEGLVEVVDGHGAA